MKKFWRIAGSLQTGIILIALLTGASLVGVVIPQNLGAGHYTGRWGQVAGALLLSAGVDHLFSTFWYRTLLALFSINVLLCTIARLTISIRNLRAVRFLTGDSIEALPTHFTITSEKTTDELTARATSLFKKRHFRCTGQTTDGAATIQAVSGSFKEVGSALLHFSLLPLLAGGLVASLTGFSYNQKLYPGEAAQVHNRSFKVRCDSFSLERNDEGAIKDYKSGLTLLDSTGSELVHKVIEVNHPLVYRGIKFYQSSYSVDGSGIDSVELVVTGPGVGPVGKSVAVNPGEEKPVEGTSLVVRNEKFISDFVFDTKTRTARSRSDSHDNPAVLVTVRDGNDTLLSGWVFQKFGMMHHEKNSYGVSFVSYAMRQSTGLLVKENPGSALIWIGIIGMSLGVLLVFWIPRRRVWVCIRYDAVSGKTVFSAGGAFSKDDTDAAAFWEIIKTQFSA